MSSSFLYFEKILLLTKFCNLHLFILKSTKATDGGRIGLALFGRPAKLVVGNLFLFTLLLTGLLGSDLFLFYFSFVIAFQTGNEIACRDETENISFPRVIVAILAYCLAFLSLVPFQ